MTEGPPRYYLPICILTNIGYSGGPSGYMEIPKSEVTRGYILVDKREKMSRSECYPKVLKDIRNNRKPGCVIPKSWYWLTQLLEEIERRVNKMHSEEKS